LNAARLAQHVILADGLPLEQRYRSAVGVFSADSVQMCLLDDPTEGNALAEAFERAARRCPATAVAPT
jgi:hypothetical protein